MNQRLSLIAIKLGRIVRVPLEVALLKNPPVNSVQISEIRIELRQPAISVAIGKKIAQPSSATKRRLETRITISSFGRRVMPPHPVLILRSMGENGSEVKRNVVIQVAARGHPELVTGPFVNQLGIPDIHPIRRFHGAIAAVQPMVQNPWANCPGGQSARLAPFRLRSG